MLMVCTKEDAVDGTWVDVKRGEKRSKKKESNREHDGRDVARDGKDNREQSL